MKCVCWRPVPTSCAVYASIFCVWERDILVMTSQQFGSMGFPSEEEKCNKGLTVDKSLQKIGHKIQVCWHLAPRFASAKEQKWCCLGEQATSCKTVGDWSSICWSWADGYTWQWRWFALNNYCTATFCKFHISYPSKLGFCYISWKGIPKWSFHTWTWNSSKDGFL